MLSTAPRRQRARVRGCRAVDDLLLIDAFTRKVDMIDGKRSNTAWLAVIAACAIHCGADGADAPSDETNDAVSEAQASGELRVAVHVSENTAAIWGYTSWKS